MEFLNVMMASAIHFKRVFVTQITACKLFTCDDGIDRFVIQIQINHFY